MAEKNTISVASSASIGAMTRGILIGFNEHGSPLVDFPGNLSRAPIPAISTLALQYEFGGREVVLNFEDNDAQRPIILGLVQPPLKPLKQVAWTPDASNPMEITADGETVRLNGRKEIVLRCGKASITLTSAGKIIIRGAYILNRSSGVNRIKGGSVQIN